MKVTLAKQNRLFRALAANAGLSQTTVYNVIDGRASSQKSKQAITNALGVQLWPEIFVTERPFTFTTGTELEFADICRAEECAAELGNAVHRDGAVITFVRETPVLIAKAADAVSKIALRNGAKAVSLQDSPQKHCGADHGSPQ